MITSVDIFDGMSLGDKLRGQNQLLLEKIEGETDNYILNANVEEYIGYIVDSFFIEKTVIHFEQMYVTSKEKLIKAEYFPFDFNVKPGKSYKKNTVIYHIPFEGIPDIFIYTPSTKILWTTLVGISDTEIIFEIVNFHDDSEQINQEADSIISKIKKQFENITEEIDQHNGSIEKKAREAFESRKNQILKNNDLLASLNVPIRKRQDTPETFSVPVVSKKIIAKSTKPIVTEKGFKPEPTLDESMYQDILKLIHDVGRQFERMPSTYMDKDEESLRDHILLMLEPNFEGSATGETFNKTGKTDILLRHDGNNIFVAECKFWKGEKVYLDTIDQLLGYLTWRDSKTAVIIFVKNKDFSSVLTTIDEVTPKHPNYIKKLDQGDETWTNWLLHLPDDKNRGVYVAVMAYHIPPVESK